MIATQEKKAPHFAMLKKSVLGTLFCLALLGGGECKAALYGGAAEISERPYPLRSSSKTTVPPAEMRAPLPRQCRQKSSASAPSDRRLSSALISEELAETRRYVKATLGALDEKRKSRRPSLLGGEMPPVDSAKATESTGLSTDSADGSLVLESWSPAESGGEKEAALIEEVQKGLSKTPFYFFVGAVYLTWLYLLKTDVPQTPRVVTVGREAPAEDDVVMTEEATSASESSLTLQLFKAILRWGIYKVETYRENHPYQGVKEKVKAMATRRWENFKAKLVQKLKKVTEAAPATSEAVAA